MNFRKTEHKGWFVKINDDGTETPSFKNHGQLGKQYWAELKVWEAEGNTAEEYVVPSIPREKLESDLRSQRDTLLRASDKMMLSDWPSGGGTPAILTYRQSLRDMPQNNSTLAKLKNPNWPTKPA